MNDPRSALSGSDFVALVAAAMAPLAGCGASEQHVKVDPTGCRFSDVVLWTTSSLSFLLTRDSETGLVAFRIGGADVEIDSGEDTASFVDLRDEVCGWELLAEAGLSSVEASFERVMPEAARLMCQRFEELFEGETSALALARSRAEQERLAEAARVDAIERAALLREEWIDGWRCRELARSESVDALIGDAMPPEAAATVWLVMTPLGETVCATRERAAAWCAEWDPPDADADR